MANNRLYPHPLRRRRHGEGGFTLIELLVVIAVLGILAAVVIFNVTGVSNKGNQSACSTDVKSVQTAVDSYINDNPTISDPFATDVAVAGPPVGKLPAAAAGSNLWTKLVPTYLHSVPAVAECKGTAMTIVYANGPSPGGTSAQGYTIAGQ